MKIKGLIWLDWVVEKLAKKHSISPSEVEEVFLDKPKFKQGPKGYKRGEKGYYCLGRSDGGRFVFVFFILKKENKAMIISARDMDTKEKRFYQRG